MGERVAGEASEPERGVATAAGSGLAGVGAGGGDEAGGPAPLGLLILGGAQALVEVDPGLQHEIDDGNGTSSQERCEP